MLHDVTPIERNIATSTRHRGYAIKNELFWDDILILFYNHEHDREASFN